MRVVVLEHSASGHLHYCRDAANAAEGIEECLYKQARRPKAQREEINIRYVTMSKEEWDALPERDC